MEERILYILNEILKKRTIELEGTSYFVDEVCVNGDAAKLYLSDGHQSYQYILV